MYMWVEIYSLFLQIKNLTSYLMRFKYILIIAIKWQDIRSIVSDYNF